MNADELIAIARDQTGLHDLGPEEDAMRDALGALAASFDAEARLDAAGDQMVTGTLVGLLCSRLGVEAAYASHPEIADQHIESVLVGLGLPRTASTVLVILLALDPNIRYLRAWEAWAPAPPPDIATEADDPRVAAAQARVDMMYASVPNLRAMLPVSATGPTECMDLLAMSFRSPALDTLARTPTFGEWVLACDKGPAYRYHERVLKMLQWRRPPSRWRLKTPLHMFGLDALTEVYPDAKFVMTHRDPALVIPSVATLVASLAAPNELEPEEWRNYLGASLTEVWAEGVRRLVDHRDRAGDDRFFDLGFAELMADPLDSVGRLYEWLGEDLAPDAAKAMRVWIEQNDRDRAMTPPVRYHAEDFGLDPDTVRERFAYYLRRFPVAAAETR
jgi:hypothetical protein